MTDRDQPHAGGDPYRTLGIDADASDEEITRAYRRLARSHHPDSNPDAAGDAFAGLTDAYDVLRDPDRRRRYDQTRDTRAAAARAASAIRIPVHHTQSQQAAPSPRRGERSPAEVELALTFDQAALGTTATVTLTTEGPCPGCSGAGIAPPSRPCPACEGRGATVRVSGGINVRTACPRCDGTGHGPPVRCPACGGFGVATTSRDLTVRVPAGVEDGARLRLHPTTRTAGVVEAVVRVGAHPYFGRRGGDLTLRLPVTLAEAALGAVVSVPTLDGAVAIRIPAGTPHGRVLRVAGRGIASASRIGDLLVTVALDVPADLNDRQRSALTAYAEATASPRRHLEGPRASTATDHPRNPGEGAP